MLLRALPPASECVRRDVVLDGLHGDPSVLHLRQIWRLDLRPRGIRMLRVHAKARVHVLSVQVVDMLVGGNGITEDLELLFLARSSQQGHAFLALVLVGVLRPFNFLEIIIFLMFIYKTNVLHTIVRNDSGVDRLDGLQRGRRRSHHVVRALALLLQHGLDLFRLPVCFACFSIGFLPTLMWEVHRRS